MTVHNQHNNYKFVYSNSVSSSNKRLSGTIIEEMSRLRGEPYWMREFRLRSYDKFITKRTPKWGCDLSKINFHNIYLHATTSDKLVDMSDTFGIPKAKGVVEKEYEEAYQKQRENLAKEGVIFVNIETA